MISSMLDFLLNINGNHERSFFSRYDGHPGLHIDQALRIQSQVQAFEHLIE